MFSKHSNRKLFQFILFSIAAIIAIRSIAQCPQFLNSQGNYSSNPYWISCTGGNYTLYLQPNQNVGAYTVNFGDGTPIQSGAGISPPSFIAHTYTAAVDTFVVTFTETSTGCVITGVVVMETTPSASIQIPAGNPVYGCTPASFSFINASTNISPTTTFTWNFGDGSAIQTYGSNNLGQTVTHTYPVGTSNCNLAVTLTAENYCNRGNPSVNTYQPIQVWDRDQATITAMPILLCFPDNVVHYDNTTGLNCFAQGNTSQRYEYWNFGNYWGLGHDSIVTWQPFNPPVRPGYDIAYPGLGNYITMLVDSNYCGKDTTFISVSIVNPPNAAISSTVDTICQGNSITFYNNSTGGATLYYWNFGDGTGWSNTSTTASRTHTYNLTGDFTVTLIAVIQAGTPSCRDTITKKIHVKESPQAIFAANQYNFCDSAKVTFIDFSYAAHQYAWNFGNGQTSNLPNPPLQSYNTTGNYTVTLTVTHINGCTHTSSQTINVYASPIIQIFPTSVCLNEPTIFYDYSLSSPGDPLIQWNWNFGDGTASSTLQNPTHIYTSQGIYNVVLSASTAHCSNTGSIPVEVFQLPTAQFSSSTQQGCTPLSVSFQSTAIDAVKTWWNYGDGSPVDSIVNATHTFLNTGSTNIVYTVKQIVENIHGCRDTAETLITVFPGARALFTISNPQPSCSPVTSQFFNNSTGAATYLWDFGDGTPTSNLPQPTHTFVNTTSYIAFYKILLTATSVNGCSDTTSFTLTVYPEINIQVQAQPQQMEGCHPLQVQFQSSSAAVTYQWDFGDGAFSNLQNPNHVFTNTGVQDSIYHVRLFVANPFTCKDTIHMQIIVHPLPKVNFDVLPIDQTFPSNIVNFSNITNNLNASYSWDFGDGSQANVYNPNNHSYATWGNYIIKLKVTNLYCSDSISKSIIIRPPIPIADFIMDTTKGCQPLTVSFTNQSLYAQTYKWLFGDGEQATQENPYHTYYNHGLFTVSLIANGQGGADTTQKQVLVYPKPVALFSASPTTAYLPDEIVRCFNLSTGATAYYWDFGDNTTAQLQHPEHLYKEKGTYQITLVASNQYQCKDTFALETLITVEEAGEINFPNAFVPSTEGPNGGLYDPNLLSNTVFFPIGKGIEDYKLLIFNKWGELIFESNDYKIGWDGYYKGQLCQQDVYVWKAYVRFSNNKKVIKVGDVTLLR